MKAVQAIGSVVEPVIVKVMGMSPEGLEEWVGRRFEYIYKVSAHVDSVEIIRKAPTAANQAVVIASGVITGAAGLAAILPDLALTTTAIFNTIQKVARKHGFDTSDEDTRKACLAVFASGGPGKNDDAVDTTFIATRIAVNGISLNSLMSRAANQYVARLMAGLGPKAVPILGALSGGVINAAFISYYETMAEVTFRLRRLEAEYPDQDIAALYRKLIGDPKAALFAAP